MKKFINFVNIYEVYYVVQQDGDGGSERGSRDDSK